MKKNLKNKMKKMVAGMMLVCSLLTLFGGVSSDGIVPYGETGIYIIISLTFPIL